MEDILMYETFSGYKYAVTNYKVVLDLGYKGRAIVGDFSTVNTDEFGVVVAGIDSTVTSGRKGISVAKEASTAISGRDGISVVQDMGKAVTDTSGVAIVIGSGTAIAGRSGWAITDADGTSMVGDDGIATAGYNGLAAAGEGGELRVRWFDGRRYRTAVAYVGEDGIEANVVYRVDDSGKFVRYAGRSNARTTDEITDPTNF